MPIETTDQYFGQNGHQQTTYVSAGGAPIVTQFGGIREDHLYHRRNFVKRPKPIGSWLNPTPYELRVTTTKGGIQQAKRRLLNPPTQPGYTTGYDEVGQLSFYHSQGNLCVAEAVSLNLQNRAITDALLKLKDQKVNLAVAWAERQRTAQLLGDSLGRIARSVMALRRGNWRGAGRWLKQNWKEAPSSWLEYQYGWSPLLNDVYGSLDELVRLPVSDWVVTVKGVVKSEVKDSFTRTATHYRMDLEKVDFRGCFVRLDYRPDATFFQRLSQTGITNPLEVTWELVPFSFVLDWGYQVGNYLSTLDAAAGWTFHSGSKTLRSECNVYGKGVTPPPSNGWIYSDHQAVMSWRDFHLVRSSYSASPLPTSPVFKNPFSLGHVANGLALLSQALKAGPVRVR